MNGHVHLSDEEIAAFVDGGLDAGTRQQVEAHLTACDECRSLLVSSAQVEVPAERLRRSRWLAIGGLAAAAAIVLLLLPRPAMTPEASRTRDLDVAGRTAVGFAADAPEDGASVRLDTLTFRWTPAGDEATYQLTLSTEAGAIVWTNRTPATTAALPDSVWPRLAAGRTYYWQVDAVLPNLRSASTGQRRLIPLTP